MRALEQVVSVHIAADRLISAFLVVHFVLLVGVLVWACFKHSAHEVLIDHAIGLHDFTVEVLCYQLF